jgi:hypothetical protein
MIQNEAGYNALKRALYPVCFAEKQGTLKALKKVLAFNNRWSYNIKARLCVFGA